MPKRGPETHHVTWNSDKGKWKGQKGGSERASGYFDTKQDAIDRMREISRNAGTELRIHNKDGKISQSDSHGNDPYPPKG